MLWQHTVALTQWSVMHITRARDVVAPSCLGWRTPTLRNIPYTTTAAGTMIGTFPITPVLSDPNNRLPNYSLSWKNGILTVQYVAVGGLRRRLRTPNPCPLSSQRHEHLQAGQ